jgi:hypothetical protein
MSIEEGATCWRHEQHEVVGDREAVGVHLVKMHDWPEVWRYDVSRKDLADLHRDMHDPNEQTVPRIREVLNMPPA